MAQRRMFSKNIVDADKFMDLTSESQVLYFHMNLKADDEGFVSSANKMVKMLGLGKEHLKELSDNDFIFIFKSGICLIRHWHIHNYIRKDRLALTMYTAEKSQIYVDDRKIYMMGNPPDESVDNACQSDVCQMSAQEREGEERTDKVSVGEKDALSPENTGVAAILDDPKYRFPKKLTPKSLSEYTTQMDLDCIRFALDEADVSEKHSLGYVRAVLNRLLREGITTSDRLQEHVRNRGAPRVSDVNKGHNYTQKDFDELLERMEEL